jgi:hypothetical protein
MSDVEKNNMSQDEILSTLVTYVVQQLKDKVPDSAIAQYLVEKGVEQGTAENFVEKCKASYKSARKKAGQKAMLYGALWCVGGGIVTAVTYSMASAGGGRYIITWGAIIFGAIQFFRGLYMTVTA